MTKKPVFWIVFSLIFIGCSIFAFKYFPQAFPMVTLDLTMDREMALKSARELAKAYNWGPEGFKQAANFGGNYWVQNFVELEAGGKKAFSEMLKDDLYSPYTWRVRHFKEGETNEIKIWFTTTGKPYCFREKLPEDEPGASLDGDSARVIAETAAREKWQIDLNAYELVEQSQEVRPGGRIDHKLVYERPDIKVGEGYYRLKLVTGGDRLTELTHFVKVPEAFERRYDEMRSANTTIATAGSIAMVFLYGLGGILIGLFLLMRKRWVLWRKPIYWGFFIAFLQVLVGINHLPLTWMYYDTALSTQGYLLQQIVGLLFTFIGLGVMFTVSFMAAESLTRKAFPDHIRMWRLWSPDVASSPAVTGLTIAGYLIVGVFFAYEVVLNFFATNVLGWWSPSDALFNPDVLATYFPWLTSVAASLQAGFWEECLFRAIPIAGAALIGQRLGHRKAWIIGAFILQAVIFGAGHASYPNQPSYARVVELMIPAIGLGLVYLYFGLLPAIVTHFAYDVVWFALPIFVAETPGIWFDQMMVIILTLVPLWVVFRARLRAKRWTMLNEEHYNRTWQPSIKDEPEVIAPKVTETPDTGIKFRSLLLIGGTIGLVVWFAVTNFHNWTLPLTVSRSEAKEIARKTLAEHNVELTDDWKVLCKVKAPRDRDDRFVWQTGDKEDYKTLMGNYLFSPYWYVRFVQFEGDVAERAEEYNVSISKAGEVREFRHKMPEARAGASLTEIEAREIAHSVLREKFKFEPEMLPEVSAVPSELPERRDWVFTFQDTLNYPLEEGQARIAVMIAGNEVVDSWRFIFVPQEWDRQERKKRNMNEVVQMFCFLIMFLIFLAGVIIAIIRWSRKNFSFTVFRSFLMIFFFFELIYIYNEWLVRIADFSTAEPFSNQLFMLIAASVLWVIFIPALFALLIGFTQTWMRQPSYEEKSNLIFTGFSVGALIAGITAIIYSFEPSLEPFWAKYEGLDCAIPFIGTGFEPFIGYIAKTILFLIIFIALDRFTDGWTRKKTLFSILTVIAIMFVYKLSINSIGFWAISGLFTGVIFLLAYIFVFRHQLAIIPLVLASFAILEAIKQSMLNAHPAAIPGAVVTIVLIGWISVYWHKKLLKCD
ncbi:MAG: CPBP family glutamic-type intramembrane protease [Candidatus Hatepunaea meridiana]|nr:CPBP family glutamic-type intramembrane protease [Candidatus Hatepunaea meridiana]